MEQPDYIQTTSANTEVNALTDRLETNLPTEKKPAEFQNRLEALVEHLESQYEAKKNTQIRSFTNQPERVNISSDNSISASQSQNALDEENFSSFKVPILRPFLDVKSIQLLRASIPNAVTNIPDEECTFWYYRLPIALFSGTISVTAPAPPAQPTPTPDIQGYTSATFTTAGIITPQVTSLGISQVFVSSPGPGYITYRCSGAVTGLAAGGRVTIAGVSPAGYNGTFNVYSVPGGGFPNDFVVVANFGAATVSGATVIITITDYIDFNTIPYSLNNALGVVRGYFAYPSTNPGTESIFTSPTLVGATIGTITRSSDLFLPAPSYEYLHMVRLLPSNYKAELFDSNFAQDTDLPPASLYGYNRTFTDYADLATELSKSCLADPAYDSAVALSQTFPIFIPGDISLTFNQTLNKFILKGNNQYDSVGNKQYCAYLSAGYEDENLWYVDTANSPEEVISAPTLEYYTTNEVGGDHIYVRGIKGQPYKIYKTLNLRLGFTWNGLINTISTNFPINLTNLSSTLNDASTLVSFLNRLRSIPIYYSGLVPPLLLQTNPQQIDKYTADSYANLVYTNTVSLYADFTGGSTYDSMNNTQLLACVPMNASNLGVTFYNTSIFCPLTKISDQIYEIEIRMLTDTGSPYIIPNSCIVSLELALTY
tara:strand:- start:1072 stop:3036 length:1965 start_codon:yes stop_codon:yes gene_type:complete